MRAILVSALLLACSPARVAAATPPAAAHPARDHAVIISLRLRGGPSGSPEERAQMDALKISLAYALTRESAGKLGKTEIGDGLCVFYTVGPDAERLFAVIEPILREALSAYRGFVIMRPDGQKALGRTEI